ncbi:MAG: hypothetical protein KatS3mg126_0320 [Lysobacteraceae bacterium]|nr:MAG: hypothetical protein KatS3mg126_0320 [Xanthomonadaceae bacterium]
MLTTLVLLAGLVLALLLLPWLALELAGRVLGAVLALFSGIGSLLAALLVFALGLALLPLMLLALGLGLLLPLLGPLVLLGLLVWALVALVRAARPAAGARPLPPPRTG